MHTVKDSVHDHIEVEGVAAALLDTPAVQRLRRIKQLGTVSLVYPSANHTRFEHSLGVYHLASQALAHLGIDGPRAERVRAAAILHDIGHGPYSHNVEDLIHRRTGKYHDDVAGLVETEPIAGVLDDHGLDPARVTALVTGEDELGQLVAGELDVDRMDYLVRDAHHTGVPYGTIDTGRLVRELTFIDGRLVLKEGNVQTAESLLLARALMNPTVYSHHVARISKAMLRRASERLLETGDVTGEQLRRMDDYELLVRLRGHDASRALADRLADRDLYKRAVWAELDDVAEDVFDPEEPLFDPDHETVRAFEDDIAADAGVESEHVVLDVQGQPSMRESTTGVLVNGEIRRLDEQSTLVRALQMAQREQWRLGVYAPDDLTEPVGRAAERVLGLDVDGALVSETTTGEYASLDDYNE
ncbi:HD domain-containing protein [Salarchaeum japonicum]|uniref:HD domain-containing protein n=1 Tax=Salarchaeum japonicum TaxID=555573 RepID=A0AAV3SYI7_9EURY|nr:HD domain-containing protein [Salarchaeum japonicum]